VPPSEPAPRRRCAARRSIQLASTSESSPATPRASAFTRKTWFFKDAGLDVKITLLLNGPALTSAMASGALDVAVASVGVVATAREHNLPMRYIAPGAIYSGLPPTTTLVVAKDSTVKTRPI
jgi:hypothetical protein